MPSDHYSDSGETLSRAEIEQNQSKLFKETIHHAYQNSQFYRKSFQQASLAADDIKSIGDLQNINFFTTKDDLRKTYPFGFLSVPLSQVAEIHATSGTTGIPTLGFHTKKDLSDWGKIAARSLTMSGLHEGDVFQITPSFGMFSGGFGFYHGAREIGATIVPSSSGFSKRQLQFMKDFGTTMFAAIVSYAFRLAEVAEEIGFDLKKDAKVRKGIFGSETWTKESKRRLANTWDLEPFDVYGFTELYGPGVGSDCRVHDGLHIWEDYFLVEVINPKTGEVLGPEEEGELVFTTLRKEAMPLIRYRSRDISFLLDSLSCDCGRTHRRYSEIKGRTDDMLKISGINFWPSQLESILLKEDQLGPEYRIKIERVNSMDALTVEVESLEKNLSNAKKELIAHNLAKDLHELQLSL